MFQKSTLTLDPMDCKILMELQLNARIAFAEIGRRIGLSTPAVIERVRRWKKAAPSRATTRGSIREGRPCGSRSGQNQHRGRPAGAVCLARAEGSRGTGMPPRDRSESHILQVVATDVGHLERIIDKLMPYVATNTSIILASPVSWSPIEVVPSAAIDSAA